MSGPILASTETVAMVAPESSVAVAVPLALTPTGVGLLEGRVKVLVVGERVPALIGHGGSLMVICFLTTGTVTVQDELPGAGEASANEEGTMCQVREERAMLIF